MSKIHYLIGKLVHIFNKRVSLLTLINWQSKIDRTARICHHSKLYHSKVGAFSYIAPRTHIVHAEVGKFCSIASDCSIGLASHSINYISTSPIFTKTNNATKHKWIEKENSVSNIKLVTIRNDVWIGTKVIIMSGVNIGHGAIIGAGAIVTKDIPDYAIAVGVPATIVKYRFEKSIIDKLIAIAWWDMPVDILRNNTELFNIHNFTMDDLQKLEKLIIDTNR